VPDFTLTELQLGQGQAELCRQQPYLVLAGEHQVSLDGVESTGTQACELAPWRAAFVAPGESAVRLTGMGRAFTVTAELPD
jgi:mannose-6-phosphate isomerase class I